MQETKPPEQHKLRHGNNMNVNSYKSSEDSQNMKQTLIKGKMGVPAWNG